MDFGVRFHEIVATIRTSGFPTRKVRALIPRVFDMIGNANSGIMEKCCARKIGAFVVTISVSLLWTCIIPLCRNGQKQCFRQGNQSFTVVVLLSV